MQMPPDLKRAYENFTLLCSQQGYTFAGMLLHDEPPAMFVIGNITERGHDLGELFRLYAEIIDKKTDAGQVETPETPANLIN